MPRTVVDWEVIRPLLGTMDDKELALLAGCKTDNIRVFRNRAGIEPIRFRRWSKRDEELFHQGLQECRGCKKIQDLESFFVNKHNKSGRQHYCKQCKSPSDKKSRIKLECVQLLGGKCQVPSCGFNTYSASLCFHHVNNKEKEVEISRMSWKETTDPLLLRELNKCCLLCSNCHRAYHAGQLDLQFRKIDLGYTVQ